MCNNCVSGLSRKYCASFPTCETNSAEMAAHGVCWLDLQLKQRALRDDARSEEASLSHKKFCSRQPISICC